MEMINAPEMNSQPGPYLVAQRPANLNEIGTLELLVKKTFVHVLDKSAAA